jgi:hypothetical protein
MEQKPDTSEYCQSNQKGYGKSEEPAPGLPTGIVRRWRLFRWSSSFNHCHPPVIETL